VLQAGGTDFGEETASTFQHHILSEDPQPGPNCKTTHHHDKQTTWETERRKSK
jgi:hypothetical protein